MHPIERLRFVARARGVPGELLASEATAALTAFADDPAGLVAACRRVLARQVTCGPLWWACARLLTSDDVRSTARATLDELEADTTSAVVAFASVSSGSEPGEVPPPVPAVVRARVIGDGEALVDEADLDGLCDRGPLEDTPRWVVGGVGVHLSDRMWQAVLEHWNGGEGSVRVSLSDFTHVVGPSGPVPVAHLGRADCPVAPELFRLAC